MKRIASEFSMVSSGSNKFPTVKQIQCPFYSAVQQDFLIYFQAPPPPSQAAKAPPGQHPGYNKKHSSLNGPLQSSEKVPDLYFLFDSIASS